MSGSIRGEQRKEADPSRNSRKGGRRKDRCLQQKAGGTAAFRGEGIVLGCDTFREEGKLVRTGVSNEDGRP